MDNLFINELRQAVEEKAGRTLRTPRDFDYLRDVLFDELGIMVSVSTLKRIWGYVKSDSQPRPSSLDPLARYAGYADYDTFWKAQQATDDKRASDETSGTGDHKKTKWWRFVLSMLLAVVLAIGSYYWLHTPSEPVAVVGKPSGQRVLHKGDDCFRVIEDYLPLFGIEPGDTDYFRPVPNLNYIYVWSPEHKHPVWHNEGDTLQLMPTITEYWTPLPGTAEYRSKEYVELANEKLYYERMEKDELRITFMRNLVPGFYVFLGIYRMDTARSTRERFVWKRVSDTCDLGLLPQLEQLRTAK